MLLQTSVLVVVQLLYSSSQAEEFPGINLSLPFTIKDADKYFFGNSRTLNWLSSDEEDPAHPLFLTPHIEAGHITEAQSLSRVKPDIGGVPSYSGFLTVNKECGNNLFFWYFPAQTHSETAPLVTWLQGGPGASSLFGLFVELGPFNHFPEGLKNRQFSWNVKNNLLFFDQPVGTGFSFTTKGCYVTNQTMVGVDMYNALIQFLTLFPNLQTNKFILTGESFAGHFIPAVAHAIHTNNPSAELHINLFGMMIGDGWMDTKEQVGYAEYLYQTSLVGFETKTEIENNQKVLVKQVDKGDWLGAYAVWGSILSWAQDQAGVSIYNYLPETKDHSNWDEFINMSSTRNSIHVGTLNFNLQSGQVYKHMREYMVQSVKPLVEELLEHYPIVFYAGQVDVICAYPMMINFLRSLIWSGQEQYLTASRIKWFEGGQLAGYIKGQHHLYDVLVRAAGHMVPADQPVWAYHLVNAFTSGNLTSYFSK